ncbi:MAG: GNAT family N-acetyltransferase [Pseudomonadota bacterium]
MTNALIRAATAVDREAITAIHVVSWRDSYRGILSDDQLGPELEIRHRALWERVFAAPVPGRLVLVAVVGRAIAGFIISHPDADDPGHDFIRALHVAPDMRSKGLGALLMREWADRMLGFGRRRVSLIVADENVSARRFYRRLGGVEGPVFEDDLGGHGHAPARRITWQDISLIGVTARADRVRRLAGPAKLRARDVAHWSGAAHPVAAAEAAKQRRKQTLGEPFGLTDFGVNRVEVDPGVKSTVQHFHSHEDEFILVLEGRFTLVLDDDEIALEPGDCAGFPAGEGPAHVLENRSDVRGVYLEIGSRWPDRDVTRYRNQDLLVDRGPDGNPWFLRLDGTPIAPAD